LENARYIDPILSYRLGVKVKGSLNILSSFNFSRCGQIYDETPNSKAKNILDAVY